MGFLKFLGNNKGISLLEVLVSLGIIGIIGASTTHFFGKISQTKRQARLQDVRARIASVIRNSIRSPSNIYYSISRHDLNPTLSRCLLNVIKSSDGGSSCRFVTEAQKPRRFSLIQVTNKLGTQGKALSSAEGSASEAKDYNGANAKRVFYDMNGNLCKINAERKCIFEVITDFYVRCAPVDKGMEACKRGAQQVFVRYEVKQIRNPFSHLRIEKDGDFLAVPKVPKVPKFVPISASQILGPHRFSECGSGTPKLQKFNTGLSDSARGNIFQSEFSEGYYATLVGYSENGAPKCECIYPFIKVGEDTDPKTNFKVPICRILSDSELACEVGSDKSYVRGIRDLEDSKELICMSESDAFDCEPYNPHAGCPDGAWINEYIADSCEFSCDFVPNQERSCGFAWAFGIFNPTVLDDGAFSNFGCGDIILECCYPTQYK